MKIAQVAPLIESVPPRLYGGTERIVSYLTEELVGLGHDVTLFASGDSITRAELAPCCTRGLRLDLTVRDTIPLCVPETSSALISRKNHLTSAHHDCAAMVRAGRRGRTI